MTLGANQNIRTRASLLASWYAAQRVAGANGAIILNHASAAGFLLEQHVVTTIAIAFCPTEPWWSTVRRYLSEVVDEELASQ